MDLVLWISYPQAQVIHNSKSRFNRNLQIYETEHDYGRQFIIPEEGYGRIDLLVKDVDNGDIIVIELKKGKSDDEVIKQISRYMGWVKKNIAKNKENVRGIICVYKADDKLINSVAINPMMELFEYSS